MRTKGLGSKVTEAAESFTDQEIWPGPGEAGECHAVTESKVSQFVLWGKGSLKKLAESFN